MSGLDHAFVKVLDAAHGGISSQSTGEQLMAALCLNRADWLQEMNYTIAEALERVGDEWRSMVPEVARKVRRELEHEAEAAEVASEAAAVAQFRAHGETAGVPAPVAAQPEPISCAATLVRFGWEAPGYRDTAMVFDLRTANGERPLRVEMRLSAHDGYRVGEHLRRIHRDAWEREGRSPLDVQPGEVRPRWIG